MAGGRKLPAGKDCFGLDQSQVRLYHALARHTVLVMAALAICAVTAALLRDRTDTQAPSPARPGQPPPADPGMIPADRPTDHPPAHHPASTLGSFLRSFTWGNVRQLGKVNRLVLAELARRAPLLPGKNVLAFIDIDSVQKRVYGHQKQGAAFGYTKIQGKSLLVRG